MLASLSRNVPTLSATRAHQSFHFECLPHPCCTCTVHDSDSRCTQLAPRLNAINLAATTFYHLFCYFLPPSHISIPIRFAKVVMDIVSSMLDLMRRLPPTKIEENVDALVQISPDYADDLSGNVDQPLKLRVDKATGKEYLACVYNQDGESYRCAGALWGACLCLFDDKVVAGRLGRTSMTLHRRTAPSLLRNCGNLRSRRTRRSIRIARCEFLSTPTPTAIGGTLKTQKKDPIICHLTTRLSQLSSIDRDVMFFFVIGTSKAVYPPSFSGISRTAVSQE